MSVPTEILIREVGPREGFQILSQIFPTERKLELITALTKTGIKQIEVTSFVRPDKVPQMADAETLVAGLPNVAGVAFTGLYLNKEGFRRGEKSGRLKNDAWLYTAASESFLKANTGKTIDQTLGEGKSWIEEFTSAGKRIHGLMISTAFGCAIEGKIVPERILNLVTRYGELCDREGQKIQEVCLADTVGLGNPGQVHDLVGRISNLGYEISLHLHDTWGVGLTNSYAGLQAGVRIFETSIGGIGGCPFIPGAAGNVATEDFVYLCNQLGIQSGIDFQACCVAAQRAAEIIGRELPGRCYKLVRKKV